MHTPKEEYKGDERLPVQLESEKVSEAQIKKSWEAISKAIKELEEKKVSSQPKSKKA